MKMKMNTDEAFEKIKSAGITHNRFVFLKMVREGKIPGKMSSKKKGYRFEEQDVETFIEKFYEDEEFDMGEAFNQLQQENEELKKQLKMPKDFWMRENQELKNLLQKKNEELTKLKIQIEEMKDDKTIRIRVE